MLILDLIIVGLIAGMVVWGYRRGIHAGALMLLGFGAGALLGSRVAPLVLDGGLRDPFAPVIALPAALLFGAVAAAAVGHFGSRARRRLRRGSRADALAGALVAGLLGLVTVSIIAAIAARVDALEDPVRDSAIMASLNGVLPPPGPLLKAERPYDDRLPVIAGRKARVGPPAQGIVNDPEVQDAARSVVKLFGSGCGRAGGGSGWIAADGIVVTNAHVVAGFDETTVQLEGKGTQHDAEVIAFDALNDVAILRAPGVRGKPALPIDVEPEPGTFAGALGFPRGGPYEVKAARVGNTRRTSGFSPSIRPGGPRAPVDRPRRSVTFLRAGVIPGNSGGPVVDRKGRVAAMVFAVRLGGHTAYAVPSAVVKRTLARTEPGGASVDTGPCGHGH
jgi:S1-C subfamily serine protease